MGEPEVAASAPQTFSCESCGAPVQFDAGAKRLKCGHCGTEQNVPAEAGAAPIEEHDLASFSLADVPRGFGVEVQRTVLLVLVLAGCGYLGYRWYEQSQQPASYTPGGAPPPTGYVAPGYTIAPAFPQPITTAPWTAMPMPQTAAPGP